MNKTPEVWKTLSTSSNTKRQEYDKNLPIEQKQNFKDINYNIQEDTEIENYSTITMEEIKKILQTTEKGKSGGPGGIPIELIKYRPSRLLENSTRSI